MQPSASDEVEKTLQSPEIHQQWEDSYRLSENNHYYEQAFDFIVGNINAPQNSTFLDVGCGRCAHSIRLAKRGFSVVAVDFSESVLKTAAQNLSNSGMAEKITLQRENILSLSFPDRAFEYILCWGVLMHIPDIEKAISELDRVLKNDGILVICENNMNSLQAIIRRVYRLIIRKREPVMNMTSAGIEYWSLTSAGRLLARHANIAWLKKQFTQRGYTVTKHVSGQFTEFYMNVSSHSLRNLIYGINHLCFNYINIPYIAFGNILIMQKHSI